MDTRPFYQSATKMVFVIIAITFCIGFFLGKVDPKDFGLIVMMVFGFYFGKSNGTNTDTTTTQDRTTTITSNQ